MAWYDKLKDVFPSLKSLVAFNFHININSNNHNEKIDYDSTKKIIAVNLQKLSLEEKEKFREVLVEAKDQGQIILQDKSANLIHSFKDEDSSSDTEPILEFLKKVVPVEDLKIWRAALYIRALFKERKDITELKGDIVAQYGQKGKNITNLCSAGYIENLLIPNYEYLKENSSDEEATKEQFDVLYALVVKQLMVTVFVHLKMDEDEIKEQIVRKIEQNLKYGIKFLNMHGIGKSNLDKINETVSELEYTYKEKDISIINKTVKQDRNITFIRFEF